MRAFEFQYILDMMRTETDKLEKAGKAVMYEEEE